MKGGMGRVRRSAEGKKAFGVRGKMILVIYLVLLPVLVVSRAIIYYTSYQNALEVSVRQHQNAVKSVDDNIQYLERDLKDIATYITVNDAILDVLRSDPAKTALDPLFWRRNAPIEMIRSMMAVKNHIATLVLYPESGLMPVYISRDASVHELDIDKIRQTPIYQHTMALNGADLWSKLPMDDRTLFVNNRSDKVVLSRELLDMSKRNRLGFLVLSMSAAHYERVLAGACLREGDVMALLGKGGQVIASSGDVRAELIEGIDFSALPEDEPGQVGNQYLFARMRESGDWICYFTPESNWAALTRSGLIMPLLVGLALLLCVFPLSSFATRIITRPVGRLHESMNKFRGGDFRQQVEVVGGDEIAELTSMFNRMVLDISDLIDKNYVMVLREKESELNALQAQINPHFLYNALDSLYWQAEEGGNDTLAENILALADLFRSLLMSGDGCATVRHEIKLIESYLHIQKMRFAQRLRYEIDVDAQMMGHQLPKLLLQPFVENAIVHGLEKKDDGGHVRVRGRMDAGRMHFIIEDNGTGMTTDQVEGLMAAPGDSRYAGQRVGYFAVQNVRSRLTLCYGDAASFTVASTPNVGTRVELIVPQAMEEDRTGEEASTNERT